MLTPSARRPDRLPSCATASTRRIIPRVQRISANSFSKRENILSQIDKPSSGKFDRQAYLKGGDDDAKEPAGDQRDYRDIAILTAPATSRPTRGDDGSTVPLTGASADPRPTSSTSRCPPFATISARPRARCNCDLGPCSGSCGVLITGGRFGDLLGRRRMFLTGVAGFTIASVPVARMVTHRAGCRASRKVSPRP